MTAEPDSPLGQLLTVDLFDCRGPLDDADFVGALARDVAAIAGVTVLHQHTHRFSPHGLSSVLVLAESHLAVHTWPEHGFLSIDLFSCAAALPQERIVRLVAERVQAGRVTERLTARGTTARARLDDGTVA